MTRRSERVSHALIGNIGQHRGGDASKTRKRWTLDCQYRRKCPRCRRFRHWRIRRSSRIRARNDSPAHLDAPCADSESRFLAMKKFSRLTAARRIVARQNRIFARIAAAADSMTPIACRPDLPIGQTPRHSAACASASPESLTTDGCRQRHSGPSFAQINVRGYGFRACAKRRIPE